jgi:catechol 2,3-dioxygenase-like lactoylglutathione lyase family enzyme
MSVELNHHIVYCRNQKKSAKFLREILGLPASASFGPFIVVELSNGVSLDFMEIDGEIQPQHYAFKISEEEFDASFARIKDRGLQYWADPAKRQPGKINHRDRGRGLYFEDPDGHFLEILTRPYGSE